MHRLIGIVAMLLVALGLGCLNYTRADSWEHHQEVARRFNLPAPSTTIDYDLVNAPSGVNVFNWAGGFYTKLSAFQAATGQEPRGLQGDPLWRAPDSTIVLQSGRVLHRATGERPSEEALAALYLGEGAA